MVLMSYFKLLEMLLILEKCGKMASWLLLHTYLPDTGCPASQEYDSGVSSNTLLILC